MGYGPLPQSQVGPHDRQPELSATHPRFPHPIRPHSPSKDGRLSTPYGATFPASRRRGAHADSRSHETQMLLHRREIAVIVQQGAATFDAKRSDDDVRGLPDRYAEVSQLAIIASGERGQFFVEERHK